MTVRPQSEADLRAAWREHCAPWIESGHSVVYGSPEHIEMERQARVHEARTGKRPRPPLKRTPGDLGITEGDDHAGN